jgi:hypothetical protein
MTERFQSHLHPDWVVAHYDDSPDVAVWIVAKGDGLVMDFRDRTGATHATALPNTEPK